MTTAMTQNTLKEKLKAIGVLVEECLRELGSVPVGGAGGAPEKADEKPARDITLQIVNKIGDCDEADAIQKMVLDNRNTEGKVLLSFYVSHKYFKNEWLTRVDIEKITSDLGVKIDRRNVSNYLRDFRKYLESGVAPSKGQSTPYRLNRNGAKRFEEIINAKEN